MRTQDLLRAQYEQAHDVLEQVIDDCSPEALAKVAGGNVGAISAIYAHLVYDEDGMIARPAGRGAPPRPKDRGAPAFLMDAAIDGFKVVGHLAPPE